MKGPGAGWSGVSGGACFFPFHEAQPGAVRSALWRLPPQMASMLRQPEAEGRRAPQAQTACADELPLVEPIPTAPQRPASDGPPLASQHQLNRPRRCFIIELRR